MLDTSIRSTTALLVHDHLKTAQKYLIDTFALTAASLEPGPDRRGMHGELFRGVGCMAVIGVMSADDHDVYAQEHGADVLKAPVDQPHGVREYRARDRASRHRLFDPLD